MRNFNEYVENIPFFEIAEPERIYDIQERLIVFSVKLIRFSEFITNSNAGKYISNQIVRSGISPALNYGEAQGAESRVDFIHKMRVSLKELRETKVALEIIKRTPLTSNTNLLLELQIERNELILIFAKSIQTAQAKLVVKKKNSN
jgi:four helix bundle protein